jgi:mannitol-1-/sugar-/sorbitol-6-phosphatase
MTFAAVLSDLDGVLVDSGAAVERVWREWAVEQDLDPDDVGRASHGVPGRQVIERVAPWMDAVAESARVDVLHA